RVRVYGERSDKTVDRRTLDYYEALRLAGQPFDPNNSAKYNPLSSGALAQALYEFRTKSKTSPLMQIADLALWAMCIGGYNRENQSYVRLRDAGTLIDCKLPPDLRETEGIKYSCWELVDQRRAETKSQSPTV